MPNLYKKYFNYELRRTIKAKNYFKCWLLWNDLWMAQQNHYWTGRWK